MFEFVGRVDQQVKIRGFRVELGEVESHLNRIPGVQEAAVVLRTDKEGHSALVAFYSFSEDAALSGEAISEQLARVLPDYMIPVRFERVRELPLTPNHKVDRKYLGSAAWDEIFARCRHESGSCN
jgi:acyl-coenzyme A synthetase/AMP-(fatty) acid ligase